MQAFKIMFFFSNSLDIRDWYITDVLTFSIIRWTTIALPWSDILWSYLHIWCCTSVLPSGLDGVLFHKRQQAFLHRSRSSLLSSCLQILVGCLLPTHSVWLSRSLHYHQNFHTGHRLHPVKIKKSVNCTSYTM